MLYEPKHLTQFWWSDSNSDTVPKHLSKTFGVFWQNITKYRTNEDCNFHTNCSSSDTRETFSTFHRSSLSQVSKECHIVPPNLNDEKVHTSWIITIKHLSTLLDIVDVSSQMLCTKYLLTEWIGQKGKCVSKAWRSWCTDWTQLKPNVFVSGST